MGMSRDNVKGFVLPGEYRKAADRLFPKDGFFWSQKPDLRAISEFAKVLGIGAEYQRLLALEKSSGELQNLLQSFQNNLDLLIQKTWVAKSDEKRKYKLQDDIPPFIDTMGNGDSQKAVDEFSLILDELAYLFFGSQSEKDDFTEYTFRIDAQMGLFWWYGGKLSSLKEANKSGLKSAGAIKDDKTLWAILLLGICYLTNF
jgi:hypothetical protein